MIQTSKQKFLSPHRGNVYIIISYIAKLNSGVSYEESIVASQLEPPIYERIGKEEGFMKLSQLFYDRVFDDDSKRSQWFLNIFSTSTKQEAVDNQYRFLVQTFGGPDLYR